MEPIDVARVQTDGVASLHSRSAILEKVVFSHLAGSLETEDEKIQYETLILKDECGEL